MAEELDWSSTSTIPTTEYMRGGDREVPDPRHIQTNLFTLTRIGGVYDVLALVVEQQHMEILAPWRLDSKAPSVLDYLENRGH